jgi:hypothetical protein
LHFWIVYGLSLVSGVEWKLGVRAAQVDEFEEFERFHSLALVLHSEADSMLGMLDVARGRLGLWVHLPAGREAGEADRSIGGCIVVIDNQLLLPNAKAQPAALNPLVLKGYETWQEASFMKGGTILTAMFYGSVLEWTASVWNELLEVSVQHLVYNVGARRSLPLFSGR